MSDNFDRKVCDGLQSTKIIQTAVQYLHNYQYFVGQTLATLHAKLNFSFFPDSVWIIFGSKFDQFYPLYEEFLGIICHSLLYFAILTYINEL